MRAREDSLERANFFHEGNPMIKTDVSTLHRAAIESLAQESSLSVDTVREIYEVELSNLESEARVMQFLPLITSRKVREVLRQRSTVN
jgi:hypothetical protein